MPVILKSQPVSEPATPRFILKTNLATLLMPAKQAVMLTADLRLGRRFGVDAGAGYIFNSTVFANEKGETYQGPRLRAGLKYFASIAEDHAFHIGLEVKYNDVINKQYTQVLRQGGQYTEFLYFNRNVQTAGAAFRLGWQFYLDNNKQLLLEPYLGFGVMVHRVTRDGLPPDAEIIETRWGWFSFEYEPGKTRSPDMLLGMHIGYAFW